MTNQFTLKQIRELAPSADFWSLRQVRAQSEDLSVRQNVLQPVFQTLDEGIMVTVASKGGCAYAATADVSPTGIKKAFEQAKRWAEATASLSLIPWKDVQMSHEVGTYSSQTTKPWDSVTLQDKISLLSSASEMLKVGSQIVDWEASLWHTQLEQTYFTSMDGEINQQFSFLVPNLIATANEGPLSQSRTLGGRGFCRQSGLELLDHVSWEQQAKAIGEEAIVLLNAPNCPTGKMDVLLAPDQMMLQIHESIGHPLELDRILGDERNYAGTSFVTLDMFGSYQYGSSLLNITYDPTVEQEFASYGYDDDGLKAQRTFIIRNGILERPLGGSVSQQRSNMPGVANTRACSWNRPPIDRMANLNLEAGVSSFNDMVCGIENGILMKTNVSWSIDDSRNKFQFGCEWGQLIRNGKLTDIVRSPNYRGISATFWRSLKMVGDNSTRDVLGTPFCGKGEPNQSIRVGHASPTCLFAGVDVFGGE